MSEAGVKEWGAPEVREREAKQGCNCAACKPNGLTAQGYFRSRMILCEHCGNKRCPHATDHRNECTRSNEPGQPGSAYE